MTGNPTQQAYGLAAGRLIAWVSEHDAPQMLWLEGPDREAVRRPLDRLEAHLATDDPRFEALYEARAELLAALEATETATEEAVCDGRLVRAELPGGLPLELHFERMALLAKRSRAVISPQVDKTGHLRSVLAYEHEKLPERLIT